MRSALSLTTAGLRRRTASIATSPASSMTFCHDLLRHFLHAGGQEMRGARMCPFVHELESRVETRDLLGVGFRRAMRRIMRKSLQLIGRGRGSSTGASQGFPAGTDAERVVKRDAR